MYSGRDMVTTLIFLQASKNYENKRARLSPLILHGQILTLITSTYLSTEYLTNF